MAFATHRSHQSTNSQESGSSASRGGPILKVNRSQEADLRKVGMPNIGSAGPSFKRRSRLALTYKSNMQSASDIIGNNEASSERRVSEQFNLHKKSTGLGLNKLII